MPRVAPASLLDAAGHIPSSGAVPSDEDKPRPKKKASKAEPARARTKAKVSIAGWLRLAATLFGGLISFLGLMALVGGITDSFVARFVGALAVVIVLPAVIAERVLRRAGEKADLMLVIDVFAVVLMGLALFFVGAEAVTRPLLAHEGDRYARGGARVMARALYFLGGVAPTFPEEKTATAPATSASASAGAK